MKDNDDPKSFLEAEVIYGAIQREQFWKVAAAACGTTALIAIIAASFVVVNVRPPAPIIIPFDPATGMAVPNAAVTSISLDEQSAVTQSLLYQYVLDRETYNQIDNDLRIRRALARSVGNARRGLVSLWDSTQPDYLPTRYGKGATVSAVVISISLLDEGRAQVRLRRTLTNGDGSSVGNFTAVIGYTFEPTEEKTLEAVWQNPLGFTINEYSVFQDRKEP